MNGTAYKFSKNDLDHPWVANLEDDRLYRSLETEHLFVFETTTRSTRVQPS